MPDTRTFPGRGSDILLDMRDLEQRCRPLFKQGS